MLSGDAPRPIVLVSQGRRLSAVLHPPAGPVRGSVAVAHPHPGHGGNMGHSVVRATAERAAAAGLVAVRFDVGGVRVSEGDVSDPASHVADLAAASAAAEAEAPGRPVFGAGFSYGARLWAAAPSRAAGLVLLAPPTRVPRTARDFGDLLLGRTIRDATIDRTAFARLSALSVPTRILVGERDVVAPPDEFAAHASALTTVVVLPGLNHFFSRAVGAGDTALDLLRPALDAAFASLLESCRSGS